MLNVEIKPSEERRFLYYIEIASFFVLVTIALFLRYLILKMITKDIIDPIINLSNDIFNKDQGDTPFIEVLKIQRRRELLQAKTIAEDKQKSMVSQ